MPKVPIVQHCVQQ